MTLEDEARENLIKYRLEQAEETILMNPLKACPLVQAGAI